MVQDGLLRKKVGPLTDGTSLVTVFCASQLEEESDKPVAARTAGHFYFWKTLKKIKKYFNWGGMNTDIQVYCQACATWKMAGRKEKAEMRRYDVGLSMEETAIDLMGPFPESEDGNK